MFGASSTTTWVPTAISGCVLWLRSDRGVTLSGSNVVQWIDQSGAGYIYAQSTAANRPTYVSNVSGVSVLSFDGSTSKLTNADTGVPMPTGSIFAVVSTATNAQKAFYSNRHTTPPTSGTVYFLGANMGGSLPLVFVFCNSSVPSNIIGPTSLNLNTLFVYSLTLSGSSAARTIYLNGTSEGTDNATLQTFQVGPAHLGWDQINNVYWSGQMAEIIMYSKIIPQNDFLKVMRYFGRRYGMTVT